MQTCDVLARDRVLPPPLMSQLRALRVAVADILRRFRCSGIVMAWMKSRASTAVR